MPVPFTDSIVIEFSSDVSGLKPAIDTLVEIGAIDKKVAEQFKKTNTDFQERNKSVNQLQDSNKKLQGSYDDLLKRFNSLSDAIKSGSINEAVKQFVAAQNQAKQTGNELLNLRQQYQQLVSDAIKAGGTQTEAGRKILEQAGKVKDEISDLKRATKEFASDTSQFDAILSGLNTIASAYQVAQGAASLLGADNEDLQKTFVKLQAIMAITNGLQQIQNNLQRESAFMLKIVAPLQKLWSIAIGETAGSMRVFRTALAATGIGALVLLLTELVLNFDKVTEALGGFSKEQKAANEIQEKAIETASGEISHLQTLVTTAQDATLSYDARKSAIEELKKSYPEYLKNISVENASSAETADIINNKLIPAIIAKAKIQAAEEKITEVLKEQAKIQNSSAFAAELLSRVTLHIMDNYGEKLAKNRKELELWQKQLSDAIQEENKLGGDPNKNSTEDRLKNEKAVADAKVILSKEGSNAELNAKIEAINKEKELALAAVNLEQAQKDAIIRTAEKKIVDLRNDFRRKELEDIKSQAATQLALAKEGSDQELNSRITAIEADRDAQLANAHLTAAKRQEIEATAAKQINDLVLKAFFTERNQELDIDKNNLLTRKALTLEGSKQELDARLDIIENEADRQKLAAQEKIQDAQALAAEINRIDAETARAKADAGKEQQKKELEDAVTLANKKLDIEIAAQEAIVGNPSSGPDAKRAANEKILALQKTQIENELANLEDEHKKGIISEQEYQDKLLDLGLNRLQNQNEVEKQASEERKQIERELTDFTISSIQNIADTTFGIKRDAIQGELDAALDALDKEKDARLAALERQKDAALDNQNLTEAQKKAINEKFKNDEVKLNERFRKEEAKIKTDAAKKQREADISQARVNELLAVIKTFAELGFTPAAFIAVAALELAAELQVSQIRSKPLPTFARGVENIKGEGTSTSDSILARVSVGERIEPADINRDYYQALSAIHHRKVTPDFANAVLTQSPLYEQSFIHKIPFMNYMDEKHLNHIMLSNVSHTNFDYEKLSKLLSKEMDGYMREYNYQTRKDRWAMQDLMSDLVTKVSNSTYDPRRA